MYVLIMGSGAQTFMSFDGACRVIRAAKVTRTYTNGILYALDCEDTWTDDEGNSGPSTFSIACGTKEARDELLREHARQF
jgi:hypothetical protein